MDIINKIKSWASALADVGVSLIALGISWISSNLGFISHLQI